MERLPHHSRGTSQEGLRGLYRNEVIFCQDNAMQLTVRSHVFTPVITAIEAGVRAYRNPIDSMVKDGDVPYRPDS